MAAFTASQASINNGSKVVKINSGESIANVGDGDFLVIANFIVEINRAYVSATNEQLIELVENWPNSNQNNQTCIVIPTTGAFKKAVDALTNANLLVNNNFTAMQDWQTKTGSVTFTNQDGTTTTVKTLKQIENEAQAQMDATHPYPWAMRKVEFEARRAANNEKFAASGFVHFGKRRDGYPSVNEGLYEQTTITSINTLFGGRGLDGVGLSKTPYAVINIGGVISILDYGYSVYDTLKIKFPPAEDGTRTYDSATGVSVTHASPTIAFASETDTNKVVTDRVDMWGFEGFLREINDNDPFVYKGGLVQSLANDINGVVVVSDTIRPITYFAWYEGDSSSRGKGVNWQTATEAQRIAIASDPSNNIYFDDATGNFYQWCVRGRSFAGAGNGDWDSNGDSLKVTTAASLRFVDDLARVVVQGNKDTTSAFSIAGGGCYANNFAWGSLSGKFYTGIYSPRYSSSNNGVGINGECYILVCGTISRLNQGAYHPSLNPMGSKKVNNTATNSTGGLWYQSSALTPLTSLECFIPIYDATTNTTDVGVVVSSGELASPSPARPDSRFHDAIYASGQGGVCRDMRYSAWGLTQEDFAQADSEIKSGQYRGIDYLNETKVYSEYWLESTHSNNTNKWAISGNSCYVYYPFGSDFQRIESIYIIDNTKGITFKLGNTLTNNFTYVSCPKSDLVNYRGVVPDSINGSGSSEVFMIVIYKQDSSVAGNYKYTEVLGDPAEIILCDDLKGGWLGGWNPQIPDGILTFNNIVATKPSQSSTVERILTDNNGNDWTDGGSFPLSLITNAMTETSVVSLGRVEVWNYNTSAKVTKNALNTEIYGNLSGLGGLFCSSRDETGRGLAYSLIGKALTSNNPSTTGLDHQYLNLKSLQLGDGLFALLGINKLLSEHDPISLAPPLNNSPAFKALNYNVVENQQAFINYAYTELTYDATAGDWGDDSKIHITDNQATMPDENGHINLVGMAQCVESLGWIKNDK